MKNTVNIPVLNNWDKWANLLVTGSKKEFEEGVFGDAIRLVQDFAEIVGCTDEQAYELLLKANPITFRTNFPQVLNIPYEECVKAINWIKDNFPKYMHEITCKNNKIRNVVSTTKLQIQSIIPNEMPHLANVGDQLTMPNNGVWKIDEAREDFFKVNGIDLSLIDENINKSARILAIVNVFIGGIEKEEHPLHDMVENEKYKIFALYEAQKKEA